MENNVNKNNIGKSINIYKKKEEISKAVSKSDIVFWGILIILVLALWVIVFYFEHGLDMDEYTIGQPLTLAILVGVVVLIFVLLSCVKLLGIIAENQVELMEHFGCSYSNQQPVETAQIETKADDKIAKLKELREAGIISQDEYEAQISKLK